MPLATFFSIYFCALCYFRKNLYIHTCAFTSKLGEAIWVGVVHQYYVLLLNGFFIIVPSIFWIFQHMNYHMNFMCIGWDVRCTCTFTSVNQIYNCMVDLASCGVTRLSATHSHPSISHASIPSLFLSLLHIFLLCFVNSLRVVNQLLPSRGRK